MLDLYIILGFLLMILGVYSALPDFKDMISKKPDNYGSTFASAIMGIIIFIIGVVIIFKGLFE